MNNKILVIGGTWDDLSGKESSLVSKFSQELCADKIYNGGNFNSLIDILKEVSFYDIVIWWPNI